MKSRFLLCLLSVVLVLSLLSFTSCSGESDPTEPTVPVSTTPQSTTPQSTVPQSTVPQSTVPQSTVPGGVSFDTPHEYDTPFISSDFLVELKTKYYEWKTGEGEKIDPEDVFVWRYYGVYGDCHMVRLVHEKYDSNVERIAEKVTETYSFRYPSNARIYAYKDGTFYTITQAYNGGLLSFEERKAFGEAVNWGNLQGFSPIPEEFKPSESDADPRAIKVPNEFDTPYINQTLAIQMKNAYYDREYKDDAGVVPEDIYVERYYGIYGDCHVVRMGVLNMEYTADVKFEQAGGYYFTYSASEHFAVAFSDGVLYSLNEAYEAGLISKSELYRFGVELMGSSFKERYPDPPTEE